MEKHNDEVQLLHCNDNNEEFCRFNFLQEVSGYYIDTKSILQDIEYLFGDYYNGVINNDGNELVITFNNNQSFIITVTSA